MDKVFTFGPTVEDSRETGLTTTCTVEVFTPGKTEEGMKANTKTIESMDTASTLGTTASSMRENGLWENNTAKAFTERTEETAQASGKTGRELSGLMIIDTFEIYFKTIYF